MTDLLAAVLRGIGGPLVVEELSVRPLGPTDILVRVVASGLCHSDLEVIEGKLSAPMPIVLGHEGAGIVEEVGASVTTIRPGDHVVGSWMPNCGQCFYCIRDLPVLCERSRDAGAAGGLPDGKRRLARGDEPINHFSFVSSHAQYAVLPESGAIAISPDMPLDRACLLGCAVSTGVGGAIRVGRVAPGSSVAIIGCGAVGLSSVQGARLAGAGTIIAVDVRPDRLQLAGILGATHAVDARIDDAVSIAQHLTSGRGVDCSIEAGGTEATMRTALEVSRPGADIVILGKLSFDATVSFRFGSLMGERRIIRSSYGGARPRRDFPMLAGAYLDGRLNLDGLITRRIRFDEMNDAFVGMADGAVIRAVLDPWVPASESS